jgi:hypothetical protein
LPWTESRSRDEWLSEVRRRGERIRRRRRFTAAVAGSFALVLPLSAVTGYLAGQPDRGVELSVAGPAPVDSVPPDTGSDVPPPPAGEPATTTTTTTVHGRVAAINGSPPPTIPPADDPVVRSTPTTAPPTISGGSLGPSLAAATPAGSAAPARCAVSEFSLTISLDKKVYGPSEPVSVSSTLEKRSPGTCLLPHWTVWITLLNSAGTDLTQDAGNYYSSSATEQSSKRVEPCGPGDCLRPVDPGPVYTATYRWDMIDCRNYPTGPVIPVPPDNSHCVPFPPGTYTVVADWQGPDAGAPARATFQIGS